MTEQTTAKLVPLVDKEKPAPGGVKVSGTRPRTMRRRLLGASFVVFVLLPALLSAAYFAVLASDRYVAGAGFTVRGMDSGVGSDILGAVTGLASTGSTTSDSYILLKYLKSRDIVERLQTDFPFKEHYSGSDKADFLSRLDADADIEHVVEYWAKRIQTSFDPTSGIVTFDVEAFDPDSAARIASLVLDYSRQLVNELSSRARADALSYAEGEVERAELRLRMALDAMRVFRETEKSIDPAGTARIQLELIGGLEKQLAEIRARIAALQGSVAKDAPSLRSLLRQSEALEQQIAAQREEIGVNADGTAGSALSNQLATYETLEVERNFAQQTYASALSSLEKARLEADRQQRYLAVYSTPAVPQYALYPRRILNTFLILAGLAIAWGIGVLVVYAVRDHVS